MQAVILAGGLGTRLKPITEQVPKVMVPVKSKPFLFYVLDMIKNQGVNDVILCVGYLADKIRDFFGDGQSLGIKIRYCVESERLLGTGGAVKQAQPMLADHFLVLNGDTYLPINYRQLDKTFVKSHKPALMVVYDNHDETGVRNNVRLDTSMMVIKHDKTGVSRGLRYVEAGVLLLRREVLDLVPADTPLSLEKGIYPDLIRQRALGAFVTSQRFYDIGTHEQLKEFEAFIIS